VDTVQIRFLVPSSRVGQTHTHSLTLALSHIRGERAHSWRTDLLIVDLDSDVRVRLAEALCHHLGELGHERLLGVGVAEVRVGVDREGGHCNLQAT
jgi:hypothetical protein